MDTTQGSPHGTNDKTTATREMKIRLSTLWIFVMFNYLYCDVVGLMDSALLKQFLAGNVGEMQLNQGFLLGASILMEIPISMVLTAFVDDGNEVLIPAPDYPLWTGAVSLTGGIPVHYRCDETNGWNPDLEDIESKITENTYAIVIINPNNPTGAVYSEDIVKGLVDIARRHQLVVMADEIYEKIIFDERTHHHAASFCGDEVLCLTFSGLSKAYRVCGYRSGWVMISGPQHLATDFLEGLTLLANMRMCANVPGQHAIQTALGGYQSINELIVPGGRFYEQSKLASKLLNDIPGVTCVEPQGALYCFPRLDPEMYPIVDDQQFVIELLRAKKILVTHGTGFNWFEPDHFRLVTLPAVPELEEAIGRIASFLESYA